MPRTLVAAPANPTRDTEQQLRDRKAELSTAIDGMQLVVDGSGTPTRAEIRSVARALMLVLRLARLLVNYALRDFTGSAN